MERPSVREIWDIAREKGLRVEAAEQLRDGQIIKIGWSPPISITDTTPKIGEDGQANYEYLFRLQREAYGWFVEGQGPTGPWETAEGPLPGGVDTPPWLAAPRVS